MSGAQPLDPVIARFSGSAPLFPLPNVVLFPNTSLPLHIFEARYRQMTADALEGEQLIAMGLLEQEASADENGVPPIHSMVGLGRIVAHEKLDDGRYILMLRGVARARVIHEVATDRLYRIGRLELCGDQTSAQVDFDRRARADEIATLFCKLFPGAEFQRLIQQAMSVDLPLGSITDVIASALPIQPELAQMFLEELNSDVRSQMLWQLLKNMETAAVSPSPSTSRTFPPIFSPN